MCLSCGCSARWRLSPSRCSAAVRRPSRVCRCALRFRGRAPGQAGGALLPVHPVLMQLQRRPEQRLMTVTQRSAAISHVKFDRALRISAGPPCISMSECCRFADAQMCRGSGWSALHSTAASIMCRAACARLARSPVRGAGAGHRGVCRGRLKWSQPGVPVCSVRRRLQHVVRRPPACRGR